MAGFSMSDLMNLSDTDSRDEGLTHGDDEELHTSISTSPSTVKKSTPNPTPPDSLQNIAKKRKRRTVNKDSGCSDGYDASGWGGHVLEFEVAIFTRCVLIIEHPE
jgi:hypothetical protein